MPMTALRSLASRLTTPLLPDDYLGLLGPRWQSSGDHARVVAVRRETADATTLFVRPARRWAGHRAGQHVPLCVDVDGVRTWRTYSVSTAPGGPVIGVTVKAQPGGRVSPQLAHATAPGQTVQLGPPAGEFVLPDGEVGPLLFVTAGSGITPVAAMLRSLVPYGLDAVVLHGARDRDDVIFGPELRTLAARLPGLRLYEQYSRGGPGARRLSPSDVARHCPDCTERTAYACGPEGMLADLQRHWDAAGLAGRLHTERFRLPRLTGIGGAGSVQFLRSGRAGPTDGRTPLLEVGEELGVPMPHGCRQGVCHGCLAVLRSGRVRDLRDGREHGEPGDMIQTCVNVPSGPVALEL